MKNRPCEMCGKSSHKKYGFYTTSPDMHNAKFQWFTCSITCALKVLERQKDKYNHSLEEEKPCK